MASSFLCQRNLVLGLGIALALFVFIGGTTVVTVLKISDHGGQRSLSSCMSDMIKQNLMLVPAETLETLNKSSDGVLATESAVDIPKKHAVSEAEDIAGLLQEIANQTLTEADEFSDSNSLEKVGGDEGIKHISNETESIEDEPAEQHYPFSVKKMHLDPAWREDLLPTDLSQWNGEHVFVISLESGPWGGPALARMDAILSGIDLNYTRAVAPKDLSEETLRTYAPVVPISPPRTSEGFDLNGSELRYALAHFEIWWRMVSKKIPFAIVLEDDAALSEDSLRERMQAAFRELNIILGGGADAFDICAMLRKAHVDYGEYFVTSRVRHAYASSGSAAYVVTLAGARKLLTSVRIDDPASLALWKVPDVNRVALDPLLGAPTPECPPDCDRPFLLSSMGTGEEGKLNKCVGKVKLGRDEKSRAEMVFFAAHSSDILASPVGNQRREGRRFASSLNGWKTYVINMERDTPRFDNLAVKMEALGFGNVTQAVAVDASNADMSTFAHLIAPDHRSRTRSAWGSDRSFLSRGEVGCGLSHYLVWRDVIRRGLPYAIVFEDDVDLLDGFRPAFEGNVAQLESISRNKRDLGFDVCFLGRQTILKSVYNPVLADNIVATAMSWCTYAYIISYEGAVRLTERYFLDDPVDSIWWRVPGVRFWGFEPSLVGALSGTGGIYESRTELGSTTDPFPSGRGG